MMAIISLLALLLIQAACIDWTPVDNAMKSAI